MDRRIAAHAVEHRAAEGQHAGLPQEDVVREREHHVDGDRVHDHERRATRDEEGNEQEDHQADRPWQATAPAGRCAARHPCRGPRAHSSSSPFWPRGRKIMNRIRRMYGVSGARLESVIRAISPEGSTSRPIADNMAPNDRLKATKNVWVRPISSEA